jgi:hypothetical protein
MVAGAYVQRNSLLALIVAAATWRSAVSITLPSSLKTTTTSNRHLGATVELNEAGYQQIVSSGSESDLTAFATRVLDTELLSVDEPHHLDLITALREASMAMAKTFVEFKAKLVEKIAAIKEKVAPASHKKVEKETTNEKVAPASRKKKEASEEKVVRASHQKKAATKELVGSMTPVVTGGVSTTAISECPVGYDIDVHNLQGSTGLKSTAHDIPQCAQTCCAREGCTSFEFGTSTQYAGCWTYAGGKADVKYGQQMANWTTCIKKDDPGACAASACPQGYKWTSKNLKGSSGLKISTFDVNTCRDECCQRTNCTSFEVGSSTQYKGCWTYTDGDVDIQTYGNQLQNWTSCLRTDITACPNSSDPIPQPVSVNSSQPASEPTSEPLSEPVSPKAAPASEPASEPLSEPVSPKAASASGDPHLINTRGERFDIFKTGQMEFLRVPYESVSGSANFTLLATIENTRESITQCDESRYITSLLFGGAWFSGQPLDVTMDHGQMVVRLGGVPVKPSPQPRTLGNMLQLHRPDENQVHVGVGDMWIDVSSDLQPVHYFLNMQARSLGSLGSRIGGLLGEDDHVAVATPPPGCKFAKLTEVRTTRRADASARMTP